MSRTLSAATLVLLSACAAKPEAARGTDTALDSAAPGEPGDTGAPDTSPRLAYTDRGPHTVGTTVLVAPQAEAPLQVRAWYPSSATAEEALTYTVALQLEGFDGAEVPFLGQAVADGAPDVDIGPRPLVVLSHGFSLNPEWYLSLAEHLSSHGFVVMAPVHVESSWSSDIIQSTLQRPRDVSATLDLAESGVLEGIIAADSAAVLGHSYGGYTALAAAGARFELGALAERCAEVSDPFTASYFCEPFLQGEAALLAGMGLTETPEGLWPGLGDPRVRAIVTMAGDGYLFVAEGLAEVTVPALILGGTADTGTPWDWGSGLTAAHIQSTDQTLAAFEGGEHMLPATGCEAMPWIDALPEEYLGYFCGDPAWDKAEAHMLIHQLTTAFLVHALTGRQEAEAALAPSLYADIDGLQVTRAE